MSRLTITNLREEDGYYKATVTKEDQTVEVDRKYGSWMVLVPKKVGEATVYVRREVTRLVAQELQAKVVFLERKARKDAA